MKLQKIDCCKPVAMTGNQDLDTWLTHLGYNKKTIKEIEHEEYSPSLLKNIDFARHIITEAIVNNDKIVVSGDYDCDGICGTTILVQGLKDLGADVDFMIPNRVTDGYGMNVSMVDKAIDKGAKLIITVDNGVACHEAIAYAKKHGLMVVLTDHHSFELESGLPNADAIVHPALGNYPYRDISGATVAYKLISHLFEQSAAVSSDRLDYYRTLAGITVISDVMPLLNENRTIYKKALSYLKEKKDANLTYLLDTLNVPIDTLNEIDFGFSICPLINAVGRIGDAEEGVRMFLSSSQEEIQNRVAMLCVLNEKRKELNKVQLEYAKTLVDDTESGIVVFDEKQHIHEGLIGIIAGRLCNEYKKPVVLFTKAENKDGDAIWKASARSVNGVDLYKVLQAMESVDASVFTSYGGHSGAAGISIPFDKKDEFTSLFYSEVSNHFEDQDVFYLDVKPENVEALLQTMEAYAPFGQGFPKPMIRTTFTLKCAKCYFGSGRSIWTNDFIEIWKDLDETLDVMEKADYKSTWSNYEKLLMEGNEDPTSNKTEYYRPNKTPATYELISSITNTWFGGKKKPQLDVIKMESI